MSEYPYAKLYFYPEDFCLLPDHWHIIGLWNPHFGSHCYSGASEKVRRAEAELLGTGQKSDDTARRLIWC